VLWIRDILVRIRIRIRGSVPLSLTNGTDPAIFVLDLQGANKKTIFSAYYFLKVHLHIFSKIKGYKEVTKQ
jgi:hypothetical protein